MPQTKGKTYQDRHFPSLPILRLAAKTILQTIINSIDTNFDAPVRIYASNPASAFLNINPQEIESSDGTGKSVPPIATIVPTFVASTINFQTQATTGGVFSISWPASTVGFYRRCGLTLLNTGTMKVMFSPESLTIPGLANPGSVFDNSGFPCGWLDLECTNVLGHFKTAGSATSIIENKVGSNIRIHTFSRGLGGAGGGAGFGGIEWRPGTSAAAPTEDSEFNQKVWLFGAGLSGGEVQQLYTTIKIPTSFIAGSVINLKLETYSPSAANNFRIRANIGLVRKDIDVAGTPGSSRNSTNAALTNTLANMSREVFCDLTDGSGMVGGITPQPGDVLEIYIWRDTDTDTDNVRMRPDSTEVTFS